MATLAPESRLTNIRHSVLKYVDIHIRVGLGKALYFQRSHPILNVNDLADLPDQWVEVYTTRLSPQTQVYDAGDRNRASLIDYLINLNLFEIQDRSTATLYSLSTLGDQVNNLFLPNVDIDIHDYDAPGDPVVAALRAYREPDRNELDTGDALRHKLHQENISVTMQYMSVSLAA